MSAPGIVESALDGEEIAAEVPLGGDDRLYITPTRTLIYRADGLLSDESVEEYSHDAERLTVSEGRRKARLTLSYPIGDTEEFTVPADRADDAILPVLAGMLNASGVTDPGETVVKAFRFSELTLVITSDRLIKHVGGAVWDQDYEEYHYDDVTGLEFEQGSVATQIVLSVDGRPQRIKAPNDQFAEVRERLTQALCSYYDVSTPDRLRAAIAPDDDAEADDAADDIGFGGGVDPLDADLPSDEDAAGDDSEGGNASSAATDASETAAAAGATGAQRSAADAREGSTDDGERADAAGADAGREAATSEAQRRSASGRTARDAAARASSESGSGSGSTSGQATDDGADRVDAERQLGVERRDDGEGSAGSAVVEPDRRSPRAAEDDDASSRDSDGSGRDSDGSSGESDASDRDDASRPASDGDFEAAGFEPASADGDRDALAEELGALREAVERQNELLAEQRRTIDRLIEELSRDR